MSLAARPGPWTAYSPCGQWCLPAPGTTPAAPRLLRPLRYAGFGGMLLLGLTAATLPSTARTRPWLIRQWCRGVLAVLGVRLRVVGERPLASPGTMVVANHVSWLDVLALVAVAPLRTLAKVEVASWPVIGTLADFAGCLYLDRARLRSLPETVAELAGVLRDGGTPLVFPEGTTLCGRTPGEFRRATFQAAIDAGAQIRPVAIRYLLRDGRLCTSPAYIGDDTLAASLARTVRAAGLTVELRSLPLIDATGGDRRTLAHQAELSVRAATLDPAGEKIPSGAGTGHPAGPVRLSVTGTAVVAGT